MGTPCRTGCKQSGAILSSCITILFCLLPLILFSQAKKPGCAKLPEKISIVVRDFDTDTLLPNVPLRLFNGALDVDRKNTNSLGYQEMTITRKHKINWRDTIVELSYHYPDRAGRTGDTIRINPFLSHYELYTSPATNPRYDSTQLVADVHLQTSLRIQNHFAKQLFVKNVTAPENLNWFISYKKRSTLHKNDRWYQGQLELLGNSHLVKDRRDMMEKLLCGMPTSCKGNNNKVTLYTQATYPHLKMGRVALSFNPITPIEKAVVNSGFRRFANHNVSGLSYPWLRMINKKLTHWQNFEREYQLLMGLSCTYNHFPIRFYTSGMDLDTNLTTIVNCAEGGHILHGPLTTKKIDLIARRRQGSSMKIVLEYLEDLTADQMIDLYGMLFHFGIKTNHPISSFDPTDRERLKDTIRSTHEEVIDPVADSLLLNELLDNVKKFKDTSLFQIWMLNVAHHTYNHMFGHAIAFDQGGLFGGFLAKFMHNAHSSNEHYGTWRKMYYNISGPNYFGRHVMDSLITRNEQGHRILIDLKHCGYATRKWFLDSVLVNHSLRTGELIPPVCSHCAANGQKEIEYSRYSDQFQLRNAPFANTFYPFELNLYDEEITRIFQAGGLIGIKLEQRGLGGYLDKHKVWTRGIKQSGEFKSEKRTSLARRFSYVRRWLRHYYKENNPILDPAEKYIVHDMGVKDTLEILESDYVSAEPFLQNLFYLIDHSGYKDPRDAWAQLCIGSDLDGVINPIDICPTSSQYPEFKKRLKQFIPIFLRMRIDMNPLKKYRAYADYFSNDNQLDHALNQLFFLSAKNFTEKHFIDKKIKYDENSTTHSDRLR